MQMSSDCTRTSTCRRWGIVALLCCCFVSARSDSDELPASRGRRPAILWATAANTGTGVPAWDGYCEQTLAFSLMNASTGLDPGFEVDFLDGLNDLNSTRLRQYNAVVLFVSPGALALLQKTSKEDVPSEAMLNATIAGFVPAILDFVSTGGGVFLFPSEQNWYSQFLPELTEAFAMDLPVEYLVESNPENIASMDHMALETLAYTTAVHHDHPVTAGVNGVWYPTNQVFQGESAYASYHAHLLLSCLVDFQSIFF